MKPVNAPNPTASPEKTRIESQLCMGSYQVRSASAALVKDFASPPTLMLSNG
jgi:hypothetical protein